jgi:hypothetical protein
MIKPFGKFNCLSNIIFTFLNVENMIKPLLFSLIFILAGILAQAQTSEIYWPQEIISGQDTIVVYQPQIESWKDNVMQSRSAVQYLSPGNDAAFGIIEFTSRTETDIQKNMVYMNDLQIQKYNFPILPDKGKAVSDVIASQLHQQSQLSLDQVKSDLSINKAIESQRVDVKNDPPKIYFSASPAALVLLDDDPVTKPIEGSKLERVINTSSFMVWNPEKNIYEVSLFGKWFTSKDVEGTWTMDPSPDKHLKKLMETALKTDTSIQTFDPPADEIAKMLEQGKSPDIFVSTQPSELLITDGEPIYEPISNTNLLYVKNTRADMFKYIGDGMTYVLISGRWFKAPDVHNAWSFVPPDQLPEDFKNIPEDHTKGSALVSVANTPQADEAAITSQIPQTATVNRQNTTMQSSYDGSPNFQTIDGTNMQYAVNSPVPVIYADNNYYSVSNGVWYNALNPMGPWMVAVNIPAVIYSIPVSSPIHYVTYVRVYGYTPTVVYVGYTPGYYGCYVNPYGTVVYGTGWRYRPWIGRRWYGNPYSYGMGVNFNWNSWAGWSMNFGYGTHYYPSYRPWWGPMSYSPYRSYHVNHNQINIYNYNQRNVIVNNNHFRNVTNNNYNQRNFPGQNQHWKGSGNNGNHYFAGKDGNVYRRDNRGNWQRNQGNQWHNAQNPQMNNQYSGRQNGNNRMQMQHNYRSANNHNHGGNMYNRPNTGNNSYNRGGGNSGMNNGGGGRMNRGNNGNGWSGGGGNSGVGRGNGGGGNFGGGGGNRGGGGSLGGGGGGRGHH